MNKANKKNCSKRRIKPDSYFPVFTSPFSKLTHWSYLTNQVRSAKDFCNKKVIIESFFSQHLVEGTSGAPESARVIDSRPLVTPPELYNKQITDIPFAESDNDIRQAKDGGPAKYLHHIFKISLVYQPYPANKMVGKPSVIHPAIQCVLA